MLIAIAAGVMGEWAAVHRQILKQTRKTGRRPDLLLVPGNSIPARNAGDLAQTHMCDKFQSRYFGGWLAPRIYYLGASGCVRFGGLRIAGISGVYDQERFDTGYHEPFPLRADDLRTFPFTRQAELFKLRQISGGVDLVLSYDWPTGVTSHLDDDGGSLFERYPHVAGGNGRAVGNPHLDSVLKHLQPQYWIAGRHYVDFTSRIEHDSEQALETNPQLTAFLNRNQLTDPFEAKRNRFVVSNVHKAEPTELDRARGRFETDDIMCSVRQAPMLKAAMKKAAILDRDCDLMKELEEEMRLEDEPQAPDRGLSVALPKEALRRWSPLQAS